METEVINPFKYDMIKMGYEEFKQLFDVYETKGYLKWDSCSKVIKSPALRSFLAWYRHDEYVLFQKEQEGIRATLFTTGSNWPVVEYWITVENDEIVVRQMMGTPQKDDLSAGKQLAVYYIVIQVTLTHRPEIFKKTTEQMAHIMREGETVRKSKNRERVVKMVKVLQIDQDKVHKLVKAHREMTCPCWGVIGHWRRYKSGKKVWIEPYRKGKKRNDPKAYSPKEYRRMEA